MFNRQQIDHLLEEKKGELKKKFGSGFIAVFYISILLSICTFFIEYKYFLIVLFAPTIIVMLINPPFFVIIGVFRFIAGLYLLLLALATYFWLRA